MYFTRKSAYNHNYVNTDNSSTEGDFFLNIHEFYNGKVFNAYKYFGAHPCENGTVFRTYAPNAVKVSLIGEFSNWQEIPMKSVNDGKFYEISVPTAHEGMKYNYRIHKKDGGFTDHCDPYGFGMDVSTKVCSVIRSTDNYTFSDESWMNSRTDCLDKPMNIYEVHLGSWKRKTDGQQYNYAEIAPLLADYAIEYGYNYIELMPVMEHPCDESWGYQITGFFSPTSRFGTPQQLMELVDMCHRKGIGVIADFVPVHFAPDSYSLAEYDGTPLYEHPSDNMKFNQWGSLNFNFMRGEVRSFVQSAADYLLSVFHFDGIRFDAVSNMIYHNGDERLGENRASLGFLRSMNGGLKQRHPTAILCAEDSTAYPKVTAPVEEGGLGFDCKWDMGWMHDTLEFLGTSPMFRFRDYRKLTFSMHYFYNEHFMLPLSHDEVVHGKGTIVGKMNGQYDNMFPQARVLFMYMIAHPGKKLSFMGNEFAQLREWDEKRQQDWELLSYPVHDSFREYIKALNMIYLTHTALHHDYSHGNFQWADCESGENCVCAIRRKSPDGDILAVLNFSDWYVPDYTVTVGSSCKVKLLLDSDSELYSGQTPVNKTRFVYSDDRINMDIPPFSGLMFLIMHENNK